MYDAFLLATAVKSGYLGYHSLLVISEQSDLFSLDLFVSLRKKNCHLVDIIILFCFHF